MANMLFANNCNTTLNGGITAVATSMVVTSATGFPSPTGSQYFYCTLADAATQTTIEIVKVTAVSGTTFTIVRGQDGTSGTIFASGAVVSLRLVRANLTDFALLDEANTFTGANAYGTPASIVLTNASGTASININGTVGATTASTGAFTTLSASSTVSGTGFSTYLASPPAIGGTAAAAVTGSNLMSSGGVWAKGLYAGTTYTDGLVIDYVSPTARFSAGTSDGFAWYNGGVGTTALMTLSSAGAIGTATWNGATVGVAYGGTGLTTLTAGYIPFGNGTSAFASSANLTFTGSFLSLLGTSAFGASSAIRSDFYYQGANKTLTSTTANIGIGTSTAMGADVGGSLSFNAHFDGTSDQPPMAVIKGAKENGISGNYAGYLAFGTSQGGAGFAEAMRISSNQGVSIGNTTDPGAGSLLVFGNGIFGAATAPLNARLFVKGASVTSTDACATFQNSNGSELFSVYEAGAVRAQYIGSATGTALVLDASGYIKTLTSSIRYKKDVAPIDIGLDFILGLNPVKYNLKESNESQVGFIAEDFPDSRLTSMAKIDIEDESKGYQVESVNYAQIVAPLVKAIQELNAKFDAYVASHT